MKKRVDAREEIEKILQQNLHMDISFLKEDDISLLEQDKNGRKDLVEWCRKNYKQGKHEVEDDSDSDIVVDAHQKMTEKKIFCKNILKDLKRVHSTQKKETSG